MGVSSYERFCLDLGEAFRGAALCYFAELFAALLFVKGADVLCRFIKQLAELKSNHAGAGRWALHAMHTAEACRLCSAASQRLRNAVGICNVQMPFRAVIVCVDCVVKHEGGVTCY